MPFLSTVALIDADNTLWDTDTVFRAAQLSLLAHVESQVGRTCPTTDRLAFVRTYDQALAQAHHLHLRYPPQLLVRALEAGFEEVPAETAAEGAIAGRLWRSQQVSGDALEAIVTEFIGALGKLPSLLPKVYEALTFAHGAGLTLYVITEGRVERQRKLVELHDLQGFFAGVWELTKNEQQFARLMTRFSGEQVIVVGDQYDRDIVPAKAAGCLTVFVPSNFVPSWNKSATHQEADLVATDLFQAMTWCIAARDGGYGGETR